MKKLAFTVLAASAALTLAACGDSTPASSEAMADNVEMPADEALAGTPAPVSDADAVADAAAAASTPATAEATGDATEEAADAAVSAAADAEAAAAAAEAATRAAEATR